MIISKNDFPALEKLAARLKSIKQQWAEFPKSTTRNLALVHHQLAERAYMMNDVASCNTQCGFAEEALGNNVDRLLAASGTPTLDALPGMDSSEITRNNFEN